MTAATAAVTVSAATPGAAQTAPAGRASPVAVITGAESINATEARYKIKGTDLGIMWTDERGQILAAFGDTFGAAWAGTSSGFGDPATIDWRSNPLARSSDRNPPTGCPSTHRHRPSRHAKECCRRSSKTHRDDQDPDRRRQRRRARLHGYMSVRKFTHRAVDHQLHAIAYSTTGADLARRCRLAPAEQRSPDEKFQMIAYARRDGSSTPSARERPFGAAMSPGCRSGGC